MGRGHDHVSGYLFLSEVPGAGNGPGCTRTKVNLESGTKDA